MNIPQRFWQTVQIVLILLVVFLAAVSVKTLKSVSYVGVNTQNTNTITVDGTGDAFASPDVATFSYTVTQTAKTVSDAQTQATTKVNAALDALHSAGIADNDIQTQSYNINPHYDYQTSNCPNIYNSGTITSVPVCPPSKSVLTGYDVSVTTQVKVRDLTKAGAIFTAIGALGVTNVDGLNFSVDNPDTVKAQARTKAISNAQGKAQELAKELGVSLVRIISFNESNYAPGPIYAMGMSVKSVAMDSAAVAPQISTGQQKVTDNVTITYEIR